MVPGKTRCHAEWTFEYSGYLMSGRYTHPAATDYYCVHYENLPMQYTAIFIAKKKKEKIFSRKRDIFLIFAQNIDCGYTLEPPRRGGSNEYPQSMFRSRNKKNRYTPAYPSFSI